MNKKIEVEPFEKCVLLEFGSGVFNKPLRKVNTADLFEFSVLNYVEMNIEDGTEIIQLINNLPYGEQARCHSPRFGIELLESTNQVFICSICWHCNNIFITNKGTSSSLEFDAQSIEAGILLDKFRFAFNAIIDLEDT